MNEPDEKAGLRHEISNLRAALDEALALCRYCDGTSTVTRYDVKTRGLIGAENCEKCWPIRLNLGSVSAPIDPPSPEGSENA